MNRTQNVILTNMCMIYENDNILVLNKVQDGKVKGITFPGGHIEDKESLVDSVIREVYEETGLTIYEPVLCGIKNWITDEGIRYIVFLYKTNKFSGKISSSNEGEVYWIKRNELQNLKTAYNTDDMLEVFENDNLTEFFYYKENEEWKYICK